MGPQILKFIDTMRFIIQKTFFTAHQRNGHESINKTKLDLGGARAEHLIWDLPLSDLSRVCSNGVFTVERADILKRVVIYSF